MFEEVKLTEADIQHCLLDFPTALLYVFSLCGHKYSTQSLLGWEPSQVPYPVAFPLHFIEGTHLD